MRKLITRKRIISRYLCLVFALTLMLTGLPTEAVAAAEQNNTDDVTVGIAEETADEISAEETAKETGAESSAEETAEVVEEDEAGADLAGSNEDLGTIEINQCFSYHTGINDGNQVLMQQFAAGKKTVVMMKIPGSDTAGYTQNQAEQEVGDYTLEVYAVKNGVESSNAELSSYGEEGGFAVKIAFDDDCEKAGYYAVATFDNGPDPGTYKFHWYKGEEEIAEARTATFFETKPLNILIVPVKAYYSEKKEAISCKGDSFVGIDDKTHPWTDLRNSVETYLLDVYPVKEVNVTEGSELDLGNATYDLCDDDGMYNVWERLTKLQTKKKDGKERYDLILGFIRDNPGKGGNLAGYTYGKPANIITYQDSDMLPTVAHEIAHCYLIGDEYGQGGMGSYNLRVNYTVDGYTGRDLVTQETFTTPGKFPKANSYWKTPAVFKKTVKGSKKNLIYTGGDGLVVYLSLHPYSLSLEKFVSWGGTDEEGKATGNQVWATMGLMGTGNTDYAHNKGTDGYNWTTPVLWDHLLKQFVTKSRNVVGKASASEDELTNADVFTDAEESGAGLSEADPIDDKNELLYEEDYRWGGSRMTEVFGTLNKEDDSTTPITMDTMFSYNGDLEEASVPDEMYKETDDIYTFAAIGEDGTVIESPVDQRWAACEFYCSLFNPSTARDQDKMNFSFSAEYPEGTKDFVIFRGKISDIGADGLISRSAVWKMSDAVKAGQYTADIEKKFDEEESGVTYAEVNSSYAEVEWELKYDGNADDIYTEVYYCPDGDDGECIFIDSSDNAEAYWIKDGNIRIPVEDLGWSRNAYVWIKATNGVNAIDLYSDENEITLCNSQISLSGSGIKAEKNEDGEAEYWAEYTGKAIEPSASVKAYDPDTGNYVSLKKDTDYCVTYENNVDAGTATVTVQGIGLYGGKNSKEFQIRPKQLAGTPGNIPDIKWSGSLDTDVVKYISMTDKSGNALDLYDSDMSQGDFEVKYSSGSSVRDSLSLLVPNDPTEKVPVTVTYSGKKNYTGDCNKTAQFNVLPSTSEVKDLSGATVTLKKTVMPYTGKAQKPAVKEVVLDGVKLKSSDYSIVYSDNTGVGTGRVTVIGKKSYTGSAKADFKISQKEVTSLSVSGLKNQSYTGEEIDVNKLPITVKAGGITLKKDRDYTIEKNPDCDYTKVTSKTMKKPEVVIKLKTRSSKTKSSDCPVVVWGKNVKEEKKTVRKSFSIVTTKLNSAAVAFALKSKDENENIVMSADGTKQIGIIRTATKQEMKEGRNKFTHIIEGSEDELEQNANLTQAASLMANGSELVKGTDYEDAVKVTRTKDQNIGSITYKAKKGSAFTGTHIVKFKYVQKNDQ